MFKKADFTSEQRRPSTKPLAIANIVTMRQARDQTNLMRIKVLLPGLRPLMLTFMLLVSSGASFPQTQGNRLLEKAEVKGQFATGHSSLNIPFEFEYNEIVLQVYRREGIDGR